MTISPSFHFHEIQSLLDPLLLPWLDVYETAFPQDERIPVSRFIKALQERAAGELTARRLLAFTQPDSGSLIGMADLYLPEPVEAAYLWYFAMATEARGQGLGSQVYRRLLESLPSTVQALIFDLEDPAALPEPAQQENAQRRVRFYRRQGARLLGGIRYIQRVYPHQPPLPLRLMVHPLVALTAQQAYELAKPVLSEAMTPVGDLFWE